MNFDLNKKTLREVNQNLKINLKSKEAKTINGFILEHTENLPQIGDIIKKLKQQNKKIFGVGAPSRAATLINYVGLNEDLIDCILEIKGSYKIGKYMPGTNIPIVDEKIIKLKINQKIKI